MRQNAGEASDSKVTDGWASGVSNIGDSNNFEAVRGRRRRPVGNRCHIVLFWLVVGSIDEDTGIANTWLRPRFDEKRTVSLCRVMTQ